MKKLERALALIILIAILIPVTRTSAASRTRTGGSVSADFTGLRLTENGLEPYSPNASASPTALPSAQPDQLAQTENDNGFAGVWVSTVINLDYPSAAGLSAEEMMSEADSILDGCVELGFSAVILQVRPCGDALYRSTLYPWSEYLTGTQGNDPGFDPLAYWVAGAHERGLELHAWINPFRVSRGSHELASLAANNPARMHPEWVVMHSDGNMYLNPGLPEVRELVANGVREIVENYAVDGVHFDDYFYPDGGFDDAATFALYGGGVSIDNWRRSNVDALIGEIHKVTDSAGIQFGVSPFGIWRNASSDPLGSATKGNESYSSHYADTRKWVREGMVDYIAPQLYWAIGYEAADYAELVRWWSETVRGTGVELYIGHAAYRCGNSSSSSPWYGTRQLRRQLELNRQYPEVTGTIQFRYSFFLSYAPLGSFIHSWNASASLPDDYPRMDAEEWDGEVIIGRPSDDISCGYSRYYILGRCDPSAPLYMNGEIISQVGDDGYFGVSAELAEGKNVFTFSQNGFEQTRVITRVVSVSAAPVPLESAAIVSGTPYPFGDDICVAPGEKITLRCTAPIGAELSVTLSGKTFKLTPSAKKAPVADGKDYGTQYSYTYTVSKDYSAGSLHVVGRPVYTMTYRGKTTSVSAGGLIKCIGDGAPFYAFVGGDAAFIYSKSSTSGGPVGELSHGMTDYITAITSGGAWVRLASGYWVQRADVTRTHGSGSFAAGLVSASYTVGKNEDRISLKASGMSLSTVALDDLTLTLAVHNASSAPELTLPQGSMFSACAQWCGNGVAYYKFTFRTAGVFDGYYFETDGDAIDLVLKRRPAVSESELPLSGITVMLDAGHGGPEIGAVGPLGTDTSERVVVLAIAEKIRYELEAAGAHVLMTRTDDSLVELTDRVVIARAAKPDLFISIHADAVEVNVDASGIVGVSSWYRSPIAKEFASLLSDYVAGALGVLNRGSSYANYYVCRGEFCPSVLLECGFMCSPNDFARLADDASQATLARAVCSAVTEYFSK